MKNSPGKKKIKWCEWTTQALKLQRILNELSSHSSKIFDILIQGAMHLQLTINFGHEL